MDFLDLHVRPPEIDLVFSDLHVRPPEIDIDFLDLHVRPPEIDLDYSNLHVRPPEIDLDYSNSHVRPPRWIRLESFCFTCQATRGLGVMALQKYLALYVRQEKVDLE